MILLSVAYLAPIEYYRLIANNPNVLIEQYENYTKQSYRNRCYIYGANGRQMLNLPVMKEASYKVLTRDIRIDYSTMWQNVHRKSVEAAYRHSPYFEFYSDEIMQFYFMKPSFLLDYNLKLQETVMKLIGIDSEIRLTDHYLHKKDNSISDFREVIHPKKKFRTNESNNIIKEYTQVFSQKHSFLPNLSIIDLIFNKGPESYMYLKAV